MLALAAGEQADVSTPAAGLVHADAEPAGGKDTGNAGGKLLPPTRHGRAIGAEAAHRRDEAADATPDDGSQGAGDRQLADCPDPTTLAAPAVVVAMAMKPSPAPEPAPAATPRHARGASPPTGQQPRMRAATPRQQPAALVPNASAAVTCASTTGSPADSTLAIVSDPEPPTAVKPTAPAAAPALPSQAPARAAAKRTITAGAPRLEASVTTGNPRPAPVADERGSPASANPLDPTSLPAMRQQARIGAPPARNDSTVTAVLALFPTLAVRTGPPTAVRTTLVSSPQAPGSVELARTTRPPETKADPPASTRAAVPALQDDGALLLPPQAPAAFPGAPLAPDTVSDSPDQSKLPRGNTTPPPGPPSTPAASLLTAIKPAPDPPGTLPRSMQPRPPELAGAAVMGEAAPARTGAPAPASHVAGAFPPGAERTRDDGGGGAPVVALAADLASPFVDRRAQHADPTTSPAANGSDAERGGQDIAALVDRIVASRAAAGPAPDTRAVVSHPHFGRVELSFGHDQTGLAVTLASRDPDFAPAVQAAAALTGDDRRDASRQQPDAIPEHRASESAAALSQGMSREGGGAQQAPARDPRQSEREVRSTPLRDTPDAEGGGIYA